MFLFIIPMKYTYPWFNIISYDTKLTLIWGLIRKTFCSYFKMSPIEYYTYMYLYGANTDIGQNVIFVEIKFTILGCHNFLLK